MGRNFLYRGQRTEDRGQRTEDRGQRTEDRGQRTEIISIYLATIFLKTNYVGTPTPRKRAEEKSNVRGVSVFYRKILAL
ncbi:hypothetical protein LEP1GSC047_4096 [Leptospira inadai serovar Lyme str. 10]|uniref:Uncharacterized protein n=2 Tax=Leptospira inadai serovar Lyme TaxID=293084 RepID=V6HCB8_9LEPT|nr:hypothetical protein LEP1GSC047_4096 [Leptospira inadai serovar Lyme str. 10]PNV73340.1 hypothetical protein BES34_017090 [Leptospira inadai serovar Lyme]